MPAGAPMTPFWAMPARTPGEREARAKAKAEYEAAHPIERDEPAEARYSTKRGLLLVTRGGHQAFVKNKRHYYFAGELEEMLQSWLASASPALPPLPRRFSYSRRDDTLILTSRRTGREYEITVPLEQRHARLLSIIIQAACDRDRLQSSGASLPSAVATIRQEEERIEK
jgi:hypothetical protein